jgi:predicted metal-dependent hydrolase
MGLFGCKKKLETNVYNHPSLGEITIARNPRARRISISIRPGGKLRLSFPRGVSVSEGLRFLDSKLEWVAAARERLHTKAPSTTILPPYSTRHHRLVLRAAAIDRIRVRIANGIILITHPAGLPAESEHMQNAIKRGIEEAWRIEARELLPRRVAQLAREHGFRHGEVAIRNTVSKWGSCSAHNDLSLSLHLMRLPDHLIDYIILHELCHTVHHNHSAAFHNLLGRHTDGRHLAMRKELRGYNTRW